MKAFDILALDDRDRESIRSFLSEYTDSIGTLTDDITDSLMEAASSDDDFRCQIQKWLNLTTDLSSYELEVDGIFLSDMISKYLSTYPGADRIGIIVSIYLLWLEKKDKRMRGICFFLDSLCHADLPVLFGTELCYEAELFEDGWWFISRDLSLSDAPGDVIEHQAKEIDTWIVLKNNPLLFIVLAVDFPVGTRLILNEKADGYDVYGPMN